MFDHELLGSRLRIAREAADITQIEMAKRLGVTRQTVQRHEADTGQIPNTPFSIITRYADVTGANFTYLCMGEKPRNGAINRIQITQDFLHDNIDRLISDYETYYGPPKKRE